MTENTCSLAGTEKPAIQRVFGGPPGTRTPNPVLKRLPRECRVRPGNPSCPVTREFWACPVQPLQYALAVSQPKVYFWSTNCLPTLSFVHQSLHTQHTVCRRPRSKLSPRVCAPVAAQPKVRVGKALELQFAETEMWVEMSCTIPSLTWSRPCGSDGIGRCAKTSCC